LEKCIYLKKNTLSNSELIVKTIMHCRNNKYLSKKDKLDVDSLWNAVIEHTIYLKAIPYDNPPFAVYIRLFGQNKLWK
jgi:hypothetical protein